MTTPYVIDVQNVSKSTTIPSLEEFTAWTTQALQDKLPHAELCIRIVDEQESADLNETYRHKTGPTNVLSFPAELPPGVELEIPYLGDIIICASIVEQEAQEQNKPRLAHWAHMVIHGILHLIGYDHIADHEAEVMEQLEIDILTRLGFNNPYH